MSGLLSVVGNAYDLIVKIFKKMQYSITGWPAGNPNVEDSNRPQLTNIPKSSFNFFLLKMDLYSTINLFKLWKNLSADYFL